MVDGLTWFKSGWFNIWTITTDEAIGAGSRPGAAQEGLSQHRLCSFRGLFTPVS